jgi:predicted O-methyltransferase YrrM
LSLKFWPKRVLGGHAAMIEIAPLVEIPFATVDLRAMANPLPVILAAPEFAETRRFFATAPSRSLLSPVAQALLYTLIRNQRPDQIVEIGTYKGGTTEAMARALHANGRGTAHTVSPFDVDRFGANFRSWPDALRQRTRYHPTDSMAFFMRAAQERLVLDLALIDGNHDFEFARFDIEASATRIARGGFILIDNVSQVGPFRATTEFMEAHPDWIDCGIAPMAKRCERAFDYGRTNVPHTDFFVIRAPFGYSIGADPQTFGEITWSSAPLNGVRLAVSEPVARGTLRVHCILRAFSEARIEELNAEVSRPVEGPGPIDIALDKPLLAAGSFHPYLVECWFIWLGEGRLPLTGLPTLF